MSDDGFDVSGYLARIGATRPSAADAAALATLQQRHLAAIPFENLDILLGREIRLDLDALQLKLVAGRRGGYCFEQNTLFRAALESLGYAVTSLAARVRAGAAVVRPRTHMLLRVETPQGPHLADVGFGGDGPLHPLPLRDGAAIADELVGHRLRREGDLWVLQAGGSGSWSDQYAFTLEPQHPIDFVMANHFTSTWPGSPFVNTLTAQRVLADRRLILRDRELRLRRPGGDEASAVRDAEHLIELLAEHFALAFPAGTRFSRPDF